MSVYELVYVLGIAQKKLVSLSSWKSKILKPLFSEVSCALCNDCQPLNLSFWLTPKFPQHGLRNHKKHVLQIHLQAERRKANKMETCSQSEKLLSLKRIQNNILRKGGGFP